MIGAIRKVCDGEPLTLSADNVLCGGGRLYTAFAPMPDRVPAFVSETEHYKQTKEKVWEYIDRLDIRISEKPYLNFIRMDHIDSLDEVEGILFSPRLTCCPAFAHGRSMTTMMTTRYAQGSVPGAAASLPLP